MDSFQWQEIFACEYIPLGSFLRGHDPSGAPCAGVFMYEGATCGHFELDFPGRQNQVHVSPKDVQVVPDDALTVEELAFAQEQRRIIGTSTHALCSSFRGCPMGRALLHAALHSDRRASLREMITRT